MSEQKTKSIIDKLYSGPQSKGRKPKPTKSKTLLDKWRKWKSSKDIATVGVFRRLGGLCTKIHDKKQVSSLTSDEYKKIASHILHCWENPSSEYIVHLTNKGEEKLINVAKNGGKISVRTIFDVQERQLIMG